MALRDADTVEQFTGFMAESFEGLDQVDPSGVLRARARRRRAARRLAHPAWLGPRPRAADCMAMVTLPMVTRTPESLIPFDYDSDLASF